MHKNIFENLINVELAINVKIENTLIQQVILNDFVYDKIYLNQDLR